MKAPERIYVEVCEDGIFAFPKPPFEESVEYVRADVVEQPASPLSVAYANRCFENGKQAMKEQMLKEQSANEELEEEIKRYGKEEMPVVLESDLNDIARHFAEWGAEHLKK